MRLWVVIGVIACIAAPAAGKDEPFGQETVEARPWRKAPKPDATGRHHTHKHGHKHDHSRSHERSHAHHGVETEHLFGFTRGSDIDTPGVRHFIADMTGRFTKRTGAYTALSQHFEYAFTPWRDFHVGLGASFARHSISGVDGLEDRRQTAFDALSVELRQRLLDRTQAPFGLTLMAEPHWGRLDEVDGARARKFAVEFTIAADKELIKDRLYAALNLIYEPEWVRLRPTAESEGVSVTERESTIGISLAGMAQVVPSVFVGGEVRYLRAYEGAGLITFAGQALFVGPTVFVTVNDRLTLVAAYSAQVAGRAEGTVGPLDLDNFERHRAKVKAVVTF